MDYAEARALLDRLPRLEVKPGLARIVRLLGSLGHPERAFPAVHVAGTNGKGSVVAMLDSVLRAAGYRVGRYTSPELVDYRDRICVNGRWIPEEDVAAVAERLEDALFSDGDVPSQFEALTALAFEHFRQEKIDVAVVEVGLGGRFDATNVVNTALAILTNVSLDHTALLGGTPEKIAWEKAGIAKGGAPLLLGNVSESVAAVVREECAAVGAPLYAVPQAGSLSRVRGDWAGVEYAVCGDDLPPRVILSLLGGCQLDNLRLVLDAVFLLRRLGFEVSSEAVRRGLEATRWPGRFEVVRRRPTVVLDGAHNVAGAEALARDVEAWAPDRESRWLVFGVLRDKDAVGMARALVPCFPRVAVCRSESPRALPAAELGRLVEERGAEWTCYDSVEHAVREVAAAAGPDDVVVVAGSLTVVAEARRALGVR